MTNFLLFFSVVYFFIIDYFIIKKQFKTVVYLVGSGVGIIVLSLLISLFFVKARKPQIIERSDACRKQQDKYITQKIIIVIQIIAILLLAAVIILRKNGAIACKFLGI